MLPPLLNDKAFDEASVFTPENLLREARRQNGTGNGRVPDICILDPDGDMVRFLRSEGRARRNTDWACYHTELYDFEIDRQALGVVGFAVGASFAVLVAEELFASGCRLVISVTSSGCIVEKGEPPYFVLIEKALRDEGTSYHYLPPAEYAILNAELDRALSRAFEELATKVYRGTSWTTDAPFRETDTAIEAARERGILCVEMEAAALYAMAEMRGFPVICFAHVTNQMARIEGDFEKGEAGGSLQALQLIVAAVSAVQHANQWPQ
jgi:uridine phosphorylase